MKSDQFIINSYNYNEVQHIDIELHSTVLSFTKHLLW